MALDSSLFTLYFVPRSDYPSLTDLYSRPPSKGDSQVPNYTTSRWIKHATYKTSLLDGLSGSDLGTVSGKNSNSKKKTIDLFSPDATVELNDKRNALVSMPIWKQEWHFIWQEETFQITRESGGAFGVEVIRKPDPPIKVAMYRADGGAPSRDGHGSAFLQMMDYNIDRIENITDKKGLEIVLVLAITSALDAQYDDKIKDPIGNMFVNPVAALHDENDTIAPNEVIVLPQLHPSQLVDYCLQLLQVGDGRQAETTDANTGVTPNDLLRGSLKGQECDLVILKAEGPEMAQKALSVAERTKVGFYRLPQNAKGKLWDGSVPEELYQYVRAGVGQQQRSDQNKPNSSPKASPPQTATATQRPRIKLGSLAQDVPQASQHQRDPSTPSKEAPTSVIIYLSKSRLEEFEAEQAAKLKSKMEEQSRLLAERLEREEREQRGSPLPPAAPSPGSARPTPPGSQDSPQGHGRLSRFINRMNG